MLGTWDLSRGPPYRNWIIMSIKVALHHEMKYEYDRLVTLSPHVIRLRPAPHSRTPILSYSLKIEPATHFLNWQQDPFGNYLARLVFPEKTNLLKVSVEVLAEIIVINPFDFFVEESAELFPFEYDESLKKELAPYFEVKETGTLFRKWVTTLRPLLKLPINDFLVNTNQAINRLVGYTIRFEPGVQTAEETLLKKSGSCRDSTWLLVQLFRQLGLAARFVSGYLIQLKADQKSLEGPSGPVEDFTDLHAWVEVYVPGAGWIGLDPTSGLFAGEGHIPLCATPDPTSAAPVTGLTDICQTTFTYFNRVSRIHEDPRVTKPYSSNQWAQVMSLGEKVDADLVKEDVRLVMGGEPTFVSVDDMEAKEWNSSADGPHKRALGMTLAKRLKNRFGTGGLLHLGQGKWYPGEPLPRWNYTLFWRKDEYPIWQTESLLDLDGTSTYSLEDVRHLTTELSHFLNLPTEHIHPAYEDVFYFLWEENRVPLGEDPYQKNLKDPLERQKLSELLLSGLAEPVGFLIPIDWNAQAGKWLSCEWKFRQDKLILVPGNSPMGLRLPLKSLPEVPVSKVQNNFERSPFEILPELTQFHQLVGARFTTLTAVPMPFPSEKTTKGTEGKGSKKKLITEQGSPKEAELYVEMGTIKTAICLELREGKIYAFMPPLKHLEHYLDLLASLEAATKKLNLKVVIEGYPPPHDNRLIKLAVTPDPGVLEINIQPAASWKELVANYDILFEEARFSRLGTEKFMLDGRHTGTGGGNHITLGGITPSDSPLLRRPYVFRSIITYWQQHPGLSYLFSTPFVGPTSQAPRVDEGRQEMLYELEIAFSQIPEGQQVPFWLVDRLFRNLLIDITGNTHRAEICIDKLYSPDSSSGRLGILELRGFDMPPNKDMALVELLLIRTLVCWFWKTPYKGKLVRWGTELYDKFMLPHYVELDMLEILKDLKGAGYHFEASWLEPFYEFRFPLYGKIKIRDMEMLLRMGIEPWHVLGEESSSTGTARYVDSSVERVEVKLKNFNADRYLVTCNGVRVPLRETAIKSEWVAGIRYRAWNPPSALHPTLGTDAPLVFDVVDSWNQRSVGGCTYFVSHPGGRSYESYPINAYEAEGRRISRFWNQGHTQATYTPVETTSHIGRYVSPNYVEKLVDTPNVVVNPEYPNTLDLRKVNYFQQ